jgi:hypothetical protein
VIRSPRVCLSGEVGIGVSPSDRDMASGRPGEVRRPEVYRLFEKPCRRLGLSSRRVSICVSLRWVHEDVPLNTPPLFRLRERVVRVVTVARVPLIRPFSTAAHGDPLPG